MKAPTYVTINPDTVTKSNLFNSYGLTIFGLPVRIHHRIHIMNFLHQYKIHTKIRFFCVKVYYLLYFQHPNIYPVTFAIANENGGLLIQNYSEKGTLRDLICKCKPKGHFLKKYGNPKSYSVVEPVAIKTFGKQILLTLKYLQEKCIPYGKT